MNRAQAISDLAHMMSIIQLGHPVRVGIDGVDASGKTMLADELVDPTQARGRDVIRVSVDGFHNPRKTRYRQGRTSPSGFYDDSFNHDAIVSNVLKPLGPRGDLRYRPVFFDFSTNSEVNAPWRYAKPDAVLLFDGIFLHRTELMKYWDFSIFVHADFDVTIERAQKRDLYLFETEKKFWKYTSNDMLQVNRSTLKLRHLLKRPMLFGITMT